MLGETRRERRESLPNILKFINSVEEEKVKNGIEILSLNFENSDYLHKNIELFRSILLERLISACKWRVAGQT